MKFKDPRPVDCLCAVKRQSSLWRTFSHGKQNAQDAGIS